MGKIGGAIGSAALGGLTGGVGGLVSGAIGGLGSLVGIGRRKEKKAREAEEREHQRQLEYMGLQAQYNKEQAKYSTELSKEMWDYTNYENQKEHLEAAGLNPALLYGSGCGGGDYAGGGEVARIGEHGVAVFDDAADALGEDFEREWLYDDAVVVLEFVGEVVVEFRTNIVEHKFFGGLAHGGFKFRPRHRGIHP